MKFIFLLVFASCSLNLLGQEKLEELISYYQDSLYNYGIVVLTDDGLASKAVAKGWSHANNPMSVNTRFCIGSCTKLFTATMILKLQESQLLNIDDSIHRYISAHRYIDPTITIRELLNHKSGLDDVIDANMLNAALKYPDFDYSDSFLLAQLDTVNFKTGSRYSYCNTNYLLLKMILEKVSGKSYEGLLDELIINPLDLKNTFPRHSNEIKNLAHPILEGDDLQGLSKTGVNRISVGIGNIVSDVWDMNTFIRALFIDTLLLNKTSLIEMTNFKSYGSEGAGLGVFEARVEDKVLIGHTGRTVSYISIAYVDLQAKMSYILLTNNANDEIIDHIIERIGELDN